MKFNSIYGAIFFILIVMLLAFLEQVVFSVLSLSFHSEVPIEGYARFSTGDNLNWALPEWDDSCWDSMEIIKGRFSKPSKITHMGWYRIHFYAPQNVELDHTAVYLGRIAGADEVYLNGIKIGGEGIIQSAFVIPPELERVYEIPPGLLHLGNYNLLAVRVLSPFSNGGIRGKKLLLGDYRNLMLIKERRNSIRITLEVMMCMAVLSFAVLSIIAYVEGVNEGFYSAIFFIVYGIIFLLGSCLFYKKGFKGPAAQKLELGLIGIFPIAFIRFIMTYFRVPFSLFLKIEFVAGIIASLMIALFLSLENYFLFERLWSYLLLPAYLLTVVVLFVDARRTGKLENGLLTPGILAFIILSGLGEIVTFSHVDSDMLGYPISFWDYGVLIIMMSILQSMIRKILDTRKEVYALSNKLFTAYEQERNRIARELHDGLGQDLLAIKFSLQSVNEKLKNENLNLLILNLERAISNLRNTLKGLRSAIIDDMGLGRAIELYAREFTKSTGIVTHLFVKADCRVTSIIEQNVFRIFQEALSNVAKHANATEVHISVEIDERIVILKVSDNGCGFDSGAKHTERGMGIASMAERATLLGGIFKIKSAPGKGTTIEVRVPCHD